jgi:hypothetical protein
MQDSIGRSEALVGAAVCAAVRIPWQSTLEKKYCCAKFSSGFIAHGGISLVHEDRFYLNRRKIV